MYENDVTLMYNILVSFRSLGLPIVLISNIWTSVIFLKTGVIVSLL
jgi:hypothetical protein